MLINIMDKSNINDNVDLRDRRRPIIGLPPLTIDVNCNKPLVSQLSPMSPDFHEIPSGDIQFLKTIGKGSFGVVYKARWHGSGGGRTIAVKKVETDTELSAFHNEIRQLSRVTHDNIVHMYGITSSKASKCLIMEFADGGSLYQFLHCPPYSSYNLAHALSWLLQCAKAIAYLHAIQPVPIIHRDLKPLNMLLTNRKRVLKICDFGTACDLRSVMTDNRGSTAWMAPEVIRGGKYNEKCDVHSWGMILWEVLTRRIPYEELGQPYRILWQIVNHVRPPPIQGCPAPIDKLMQSCWLDEHSARPTMQEVVDTIYPLCKLLNIKEESFSFSSSPTDSYTESCVSLINEGSSADHTSRDVSEFTNSTNNIDLMVDESSGLSPETPATIGISFEEEINSSAGNAHLHPPQVTFSSNVSASVVVGVENLLPPWGSAKSDEINSRSNISAPSTPENSSDCLVHNTNGNLSPFVLVDADHKDSSPFVFPERTSCTVSSTTNTETFSPIDVFPAKGDVSQSTFTKNERKISPSVFTPLSISIPNLGPPERTDVGLTTVAHSSNVLYSSSSSSPLINYIHSGYVTPVRPSVSCSATSTHTSRIHCPTTAVSSLRMGSNYFLPAVTYSFPEQPIASPNILTSPSITSIATSLTLVSPMKAKPYDSPVISNEISQGMVTLRKNLTPSDPAAIYRRRSAEVPLNSTNYKGISSGQGHRRSSSYESKELIGFEPLLNEVLQESSLEDRYIVSQPKIIKHNFSSEKLTQDDGRLKGTFSSPGNGNPSQSSGIIISGQPCITLASHESSALSNISFGSSGGTITPSYSHHLTSGVAHTPITTATTRGSTISSPLSIRGSGSPSGRTPNVIPFKKGTIGGGTTDRVSENEELGALWELLDDDLKPAMPVPSNPNSQQIFDEHKSLAHQLLVVQEEIVFLDQEKSKLRMKVKGQDSEQIACKKRYNDKIFDLQNKNETLQLNHSRLSQQLEEIRSRNRQRCSESWNPSEAVPPQSVHSPHNHSHPRSTVEESHWSPHRQRQQYYHQLHSPMQHMNLQQHYYHDHSVNSPPNPPNPKRN